MNIVVVGGGIAGLAAAYSIQEQARERDLPLSLRILEREPRWGGKILTERIDEFVVEGGPDTFIAAKPWAVDLCRELGIADRLLGTNPDQKNTYILHRDRLHLLPGGLTLMIPTEIRPMLLTGLLSLKGKARMGLDFLIPPLEYPGDESMGEFVTRRLGREAYERLIEPLMSGIYAGDGDKLSLQATMPYLRDLESKHGGLVRGALAARRERVRNGRHVLGSRSLFLTPMSGLMEIVEALVDALRARGTTMLHGTEVTRITHEAGTYRLSLEDSSSVLADGLVLATPGFVSGALMENLDPDLAAELKAIEYVSTATVSLAFRKDQLSRPLDGYGYVIPRGEGREVLACTWTSTKFPHRAPEGYALLRVFIGRAGVEDRISWEENDLIDLARSELKRTLGITSAPLFTRVHVWEQAMPQYNVGHNARLERIEKALECWPGLSLAGNAYRGIGIPDCIRSGRRAAAYQIERLASGLACPRPSMNP